MGKWRRHSREFKREAVERMKISDNIHELARELQVERKLLYSWKYQLEGRPEKNHSNYAGRAADDTVENRLRRENKERKEALGQRAAELDFFRRYLAKSEPTTAAERKLWRSTVYAEIHAQTTTQGRLNVEEMCWLARVSRAGYYRQLVAREAPEEDLQVRAPFRRSCWPTTADMDIVGWRRSYHVADWRSIISVLRASCGKTTCSPSSGGSL